MQTISFILLFIGFVVGFIGMYTSGRSWQREMRKPHHPSQEGFTPYQKE